MLYIVKNEGKGSKYGSFKCPCGGRADYKFTASAGSCRSCDTSFLYCGGINFHPFGKFRMHIIDLQAE